MDLDNELFYLIFIYYFIVEILCGAYKLFESSDDFDNEIIRLDSSKDKLNEFLSSRDISFIRFKLKISWYLIKERIKFYYVRKAR